jgi:hypothetical protein
MNRILALGLLIASTVASAQTPQIRNGSTIYIEPMGGYETYLAASLMKEKVPVVIVTQKDHADYILTGGAVHSKPNHPSVVINNSATASINEGETPNQQAWNQGWAQGQQAAAARAEAKAAMGYSDVRISIVDAKSTQIVFAFSGEKNGSNQLTKTAEQCARHLKEFIKKSEKKSQN